LKEWMISKGEMVVVDSGIESNANGLAQHYAEYGLVSCGREKAMPRLRDAVSCIVAFDTNLHIPASF
jgi:hypothetical protein